MKTKLVLKCVVAKPKRLRNTALVTNCDTQFQKIALLTKKTTLTCNLQ